MSNWMTGEKVQVSLPYGPDDVSVHAATIGRVQDPGPQDPECTVKVIFDDPMVYGGLGYAWVRPDVISLPGQEPKRERNIVIG